ncbi:tRNA synthetases class I (M)-domain-containing protein [Aspergillus caelatus]|uniref:methionine--tRNA ligase n=1 Tax=Aspergillus caelatus TaxID=61420 RepID=A0A5N7A8P0_9EURO|nr:tRNA synthetases class I (M)-domain-containing protein [Aspergillus caelatus]KAE8364940.1 tRNA synthetases class I (M)-domain-containing protein [Aspergillus caelatus]
MTEQNKPILPESGKRNFLVTSALPYVNNVPHLGNLIGSTLSADVFARYGRGRGANTLYVCGTDEYGTTSEARAIQENMTTKELCDKYYTLHAEVYKWFNISFDIFGRTTTELQTKITQDIFLKLHDNGFLSEHVTTQLYCEEHKSFLADRFIQGECPHCKYIDAYGDQCDLCGQLLDPLDLIKPRCKLDGATPVKKDTKHIFLKLDKLQPEIQAFFDESSTKGGWSQNGKDITSSWLTKGLQERSITRDIKWGTQVPLPGYEEKVIYSWFDACIGYVSITANYTDQWEKWWRNPEEVELYQFIGKDNVAYHSVMFPGTEIGTREKWLKVHHLSTTEYLTYEGGKFSKSRGIGVFGDSAKKTGIPADVWRYYLLSHRPETGDSEFNWDLFISSNNNILLKNLGNFVSRVVKFVNSKNYDNIVPDYTAYTDPAFDAWKEEVNELLTQYIQQLDAVKIRAAIDTVLTISQKGNLFLQSNSLDNKLAENEPAKCAAVIGLALNLIHLLSALLAPYMPETAASINEILRTEAILIPDRWNADTVKPNHEIGKAKYLFSNIKPEKANEWRDMFGDEEAKKVKEEEAKKKAAKKAEKLAKKEKKKEQKEKEAASADGVAEVSQSTEKLNLQQ